MKMSKKRQVLKHVHHFPLWQIKTNCIKLFSFLNLPISRIYKMVLNKKLIPCILQLKTQIKIILNLSKYHTSLLYQITWLSLTQFLWNMESFYTSDNLNLI